MAFFTTVWIDRKANRMESSMAMAHTLVESLNVVIQVEVNRGE